jgi:hypothetical protein
VKKIAVAFVWMVVFFLAYTGYAYAESVDVKYNTNTSSDAKVETYLYSEDLSKTATFTIGKKNGFLINRLYWIDENGNELRDATGNWQGKESFAGSDTIQGKGFMVKTTNSKVYGGIYYWDRSGGTHLWRANGDGFVRDSNDPACPNPGVLDEWDYKRYPNCTDSGLSLKVEKVGSYYLEGNEEKPVIPEKSIRLDSLKPVDVLVNGDLLIQSIHKTYGKTDPSTTKYLNTYSALTKSSVRLNFRQTFGQYAVDNTQYKDWANPGARQMWWYAAFSVNFQAMTYRYQDKQLVVEWASKEQLNERSTINVRHIVRTGPTGSYTTAAQSVIPFNKALPFSEPVEAGDYGKLLGSNTNYIGFGSTLIQNTAPKINVTLSKTNNQTNAYVTFMYEKEAPKFTGDFDIVPSTIDYRESFSFVPKNFQMNACVYQSHKYKIERGGTFVSETQTGGQNQKTSYSYSKYPWNIGVGTHTVSINIKTSCGETGWINPKPLTVNDMADNSPPRFKVGFVYPAAQKYPVYQVVEGTVLNLIYIEDPSVPTPDDPDGDDVYFMGFDTEGSISRFIRELPSKYEPYGNGYHRITMDALGYHHVTAQMRDQWGATSTASTWIQVIPKNPIAIAKGPATVKSGRPVPNNLFDSSQSYSPVGRKINHARDEWENKKDKYINETEDNIFEYVMLHVYDSEGLKSIDPGMHTLIVEPDLPPVAKLEVPSLAVRNQTADIVNRSYSPDGDKIVKTEYKYKYDANNNGFDDDEWVTLLIGTDKALPFKPTKVGKYLFYVKVTEDYGKWGDTDWQEEELLIMDVVNDSPTISFDMEGKNEQPDLEPLTPIKPEDILKDWKLYEVNRTALLKWPEIKWYADGKTLSGTTGKLKGSQEYPAHGLANGMVTWSTPMKDEGFGPNNLSPYRAIKTLDFAKSQPLLTTGKSAIYNPRIWTNESHFYYLVSSGSYYTLYAVDKAKVGRYSGKEVSYLNSANYWQVRYDHEWLDGSPIVFSMGQYHESWKTHYFDVTDKTVYQYGNEDLVTYDAFTGERITTIPYTTIFANTERYGAATMGLSKGDNILFYSYASETVYEVDRKGRIVKSYPSKLVFDNLNYTTFYEAADGWYYLTQGESAPYLNKINKSNLKLAWSTRLSGQLLKITDAYTNSYVNQASLKSNVIINPVTNDILVNTIRDYSGYKNYEPVLDMVDGKTGRLKSWDRSITGQWNSSATEFEMDWYGNYLRHSSLASYPSIRTADGWTTNIDPGRYVQTYGPAGMSAHFISHAIATADIYSKEQTVDGKFGTYVGDGMFIAFSTTRNFNGTPTSNFMPVLHVGQPSDTPLIYDAFSLGQWVSKTKLKNAELAFNMTLYQPKVNNKLAGMSFRMQNPMNRYAVEADGQKLYLSKYTGGNRTVLATQNFIAQPAKAYSFRILMQGEATKVYMDGVPYFEVTDSQYDDGYFGMFSDRGLVDFDKIGFKELPDGNVWSTQYAIWEEEDAAASIRTDNVIFEDPENDPIAELDWSIFHTPRFINNQGQSSLHGKSITEGELKLDNVGDYKVALRGRDDPNPKYLMPNMTFDDYRKNSNEFVRMITVHRRPVADFEVQQRASDGQVLWTDKSYDPDRYESATHYSDEVTGIDYKATKGILEKRFYYITPSGDYVPEKLITPQEKGTYEVALAVKDEYGAWSPWTIRTLVIDKLPPPNTPPTPGFTKTHTTTYRGVTVTIDSTASDLEDGDRTKLPHTYYVRNKTSNGAEAIRSSSRTNWNISFDKLGTYNIRQVVEDSHGATAQMEQEISIVNRKPVANVTYPTSTDQNNPTKVTELRPAFTWTYSDADNDAQVRYQVQIYRYGGVLLLDSGSRNGADKSWTANADLPERTSMYVQVRVHDNFEWSDWSTVRYFYVETNQPPTADFTWSPQPVYEGDTVQIISNVSDPDRDTLSVVYELTDPKGAKTTFNYTLNPNGATYPTTGPSLRMLQVGNWTMKLTVSDGKAEPVSVTKTVRVLELGLSAQVTHAEDWEKNRLAWNEKNPGKERSPSTFWAGERFVLMAQATNTGSSETKATKIEVRAVDVGRTTLQSNDTVNWSGYIGNVQAEKALEKLANGPYDFVFAVTYNNGIVKTTTVRINILGHWSQYFKLHQSW